MGAAATMEAAAARVESLLHLSQHKAHDAPAFNLAALPADLADALKDYDMDGDGTVSVTEIAAGAHLLRRQKEKTATFRRVIILLTVFSFVQLGALFGLVWGVVAANTQTRVSSTQPVMMVKGTDTPVQVSSADFVIDADGVMRLRSPASTAGAVTTSGGRRHLLQADAAVTAAAGSAAVARVSSADFSVSNGIFMVPTPDGAPVVSGLDALVSGDANATDGGRRRRLLQTSSGTTATAPLTMFTPVCDWTSPDLFNASACDRANPPGQYYGCVNMVNSCSQFRFSTKLSLFMLSEGGAWQGTYSAGTGFWIKPAAIALTVSRIDYIAYARVVPKTVCYMDMYRIYTETNLSSWVDLCLYPPPTTLVTVEYGNSWIMGEGSEYCPNCPTGPFLDYTNLKHDPDLFDLPCRPGLYGNITIFNNGAKQRSIPPNYCFLSLGQVYDPKYLFDIQFPSFYGDCSSPFNCPPPPTAAGRHLLQTSLGTAVKKSGLGAK